MNLDRILPVCSKDEMRPHLAQPFLVDLDGAPWTCATDGHRLAAIEGRHAGEVERAPSGEVRAHLRLPKSGVEVSTAALLAWAGEVPGPMPCTYCGGTGQEECGHCYGTTVHACDCGHDHSCASCDGAGKGECGWCDGDGLGMPPKRPGAILGVTFDRNLLPDVLASAPATVRMYVGKKSAPALLLWADGWRAIVMSFDGEPVGPAFEVPR